MRYADFMGFPFPQHLLMQKTEGLVADPCMREFSFMHMTSVPPPVTNFDVALKEHRWFKQQIERVGLAPIAMYGMQNPPAGLTHEQVGQLAREGVQFMCLSYFGANEYGGGFHTPDLPLTRAGRDLIESMLEWGIVVDLSHAGHRTARDVLDYFETQPAGNVLGAVVASHTACHKLYQHGRNLPDDVLHRIRSLHGLIGLATVSWLLSKNDDSLEPFLRHLGHLIGVVGEDCAVIGSDGVYASMDEKEEVRRFAFMSEKLDPTGDIFHARLPEECPDIHGPERMYVLSEAITTRFGERIATKVLRDNLLGWFN